MKKLIAIILSLLTITAASFGLAGCKKEEEEYDPIVYTATEPLVIYDTTFNYEIGLGIEGTEMLVKSNYFESFADYYKENLIGSKMFLLDYGLKFPNWFIEDDDLFRLFKIFRNQETEETIIYECFKLYDEDLGSHEEPDKIGGMHVSLSLDIFIKPLSNYSNEDLTFEYGKLGNKRFQSYTYINIYLGEECFATCFYSLNTKSGYIENEWFENYFNKNLIWGDTYEI